MTDYAHELARVRVRKSLREGESKRAPKYNDKLQGTASISGSERQTLFILFSRHFGRLETRVSYLLLSISDQ